MKRRLLILSDYWGDLGGGEVVAAHLAHGLSREFDIGLLTTDRHRDSGGHERATARRLEANVDARGQVVAGISRVPTRGQRKFRIEAANADAELNAREAIHALARYERSRRSDSSCACCSGVSSTSWS